VSRGRGRAARRAGSSAPAAPTAPAPAAAPAPLPPLLRDPWLWAALSTLLLLVFRSLGTPFGEPVADDFDHLHHAMFSRDHSWLGAGGSGSFWRPLVYEGYYGLLQGVIRTHPAWITVLHVALLALVVALAYDIARRHLPRPAAACAADFLLLLESTRALIIVPVHFVDLGLIVFSVLAWRAAVAGRLIASLAALAAALLCKETGIATALVLPWLAEPRAGDSRRRWIVATLAVTLVWAALYIWVRTRLALALPRGLEAQLSPSMIVDAKRYAWAIAGTLRALVSLPLRAAEHEWLVVVASLLVFGAAAVRFATDRGARDRLARHRGFALSGLAWGVLATGTLLTVYPVWSPERVAYSSLGLGVASVTLLAAAHPLLPWALVAMRVLTFCMAPAAPAQVTRSVPDRGAFVDFERLARLQRLMVEARTTLKREFPVLPPHAGVAMLHPPFQADYAAGDRAIQVWYADSTVRWLRWDRMAAAEARDLHGAMEFREDTEPQFRRLEPEGLRLLFEAGTLQREEKWAASLDTLRRADALQRDREAHHFLGRVAGLESWCLGGMGRLAEAESTARQSLVIAPENADGHLTLAAIYNGRNEWEQAIAQLDTLQTWYPNYEAAVMMRQGVMERMRAAPRAATPNVFK
jgi:tetratricopeptide (TPR) repeat protein